jgi:hypothetical protein
MTPHDSPCRTCQNPSMFPNVQTRAPQGSPGLPGPVREPPASVGLGLKTGTPIGDGETGAAPSGPNCRQVVRGRSGHRARAQSRQTGSLATARGTGAARRGRGPLSGGRRGNGPGLPGPGLLLPRDAACVAAGRGRNACQVQEEHAAGGRWPPAAHSQQLGSPCSWVKHCPGTAHGVPDPAAPRIQAPQRAVPRCGPQLPSSSKPFSLSGWSGGVRASAVLEGPSRGSARHSTAQQGPARAQHGPARWGRA